MPRSPPRTIGDGPVLPWGEATVEGEGARGGRGELGALLLLSFADGATARESTSAAAKPRRRT